MDDTKNNAIDADDVNEDFGDRREDAEVHAQAQKLAAALGSQSAANAQRMYGGQVPLGLLGHPITESPAQVAERLRWEARHKRQEYLAMALGVAQNFRTVQEVFDAADAMRAYVEGADTHTAELIAAFETEPKLDGMALFVGTKALYARPMTRGEYNDYQGWTLPEGENPNDLGQIVQYSDGYISWSPQPQFDAAYKRV